MTRRDVFARVHTWFITNWEGRLYSTDCEVRAREMCKEYGEYYETLFDAIYSPFGVCPISIVKPKEYRLKRENAKSWCF